MTVTLPAPPTTGAPAAAGAPRRRVAPMLAPAFVAAIAYVDPGNVATNFAAGAAHGYLLVWVVVAANLMAMLVQSLAAKLGLATGADLAQLSRRHFPGWVSRCLWVQAELVVLATDLAEIVGGAVALNMLLGLPLPQGGLLTGVVAYGLSALRARGYRPFERVIVGLFALIAAGFLLTLLQARPAPVQVAGGLLPSFDGGNSVMLAASILGATVMPHAVYLHSALHHGGATHATTRERAALVRRQRRGIVYALGLAGLVNVAMLLTAAATVRGGDGATDSSLAAVQDRLGAALGAPFALLFAVALLVSGFASSGVGAVTGDVVMAGYLRRHVRPVLRRLFSLAPPLALLMLGVDPTAALVASQVVLSFGIPFVLVPLILLTRRPDVMGTLANHRWTTATAACCAATLSALNASLIFDSLPIT
jgi:manganese transport protein